MMGGDPAFGQLISSNQSCTAFINEYHIRENYSLLLPHPFRGENVKQVARKTFDILQTSKISLVEAFGFSQFVDEFSSIDDRFL